MHASLSRAALVVALVGPLSLQGWAQQAETKDKKDARDPGIYVKTDGSDSLVKLHAELGTDQKTKGITKTILTQGLVQPTHEAHLNGVKADTRVTAGNTEFYLYLTTDKSKPDPSADPMAALAAMAGMTGDVMPSQAKGGNDFVLIQLKVGDTGRIADLGKVNAKLPKDPIACTVDHLPDGSYRFTPKQALGAGEYAFVFVGAMMPGGQYWDFGVDAAK